MRPTILVVLGILYGASCRGSRDVAVDSGSAATSPHAGPCAEVLQYVEGDVSWLTVGPSPCGVLSLVDARVEPLGSRVEMFIDIDGTQIFPAVTAAGPVALRRVVWDGTFELPGRLPIEVLTWPRRLGDATVSGPLEDAPVRGSGGVLLGRPDGGWLLVAAVGQTRNELVVEVRPPDRLTIAWGDEALTLLEGGRVFFDVVTLAVGPDPGSLLARWKAEVDATLEPSPRAVPSLFGPTDAPEVVTSLAELDPTGRVGGVITERRGPAVRQAVRATGRRWLVRADPFTVDPADAPEAVVRIEGSPVLVDGRAVLDPTSSDGFERVRQAGRDLAEAQVDGVWLQSASALVVEGDRADTQQSGISAYRLGLEAFRAGLGPTPRLVVEGALPLASIGIADALAWPEATPAVVTVATASAWAHATPSWWQLGPVQVSTASDAALSLDLAAMVVAGGRLRLAMLPVAPTHHRWLFDPAPQVIDALAGQASPAEPRWAVVGPHYVGPTGIVTLVNPGQNPIDTAGPGGRRWPDGDVAPAGGIRSLAPGDSEVWLPD